MTQNSNSKNAPRIDELEVKAAFQEQLIAELNDELVQHGRRISELEQKLERVIEFIKSPSDEPGSAHEPPPPHY